MDRIKQTFRGIVSLFILTLLKPDEQDEETRGLIRIPKA